MKDFGTAFCGQVLPRLPEDQGLGQGMDEGLGSLCAGMVRGDF